MPEKKKKISIRKRRDGFKTPNDIEYTEKKPSTFKEAYKRCAKRILGICTSEALFTPIVFLLGCIVGIVLFVGVFFVNWNLVRDAIEDRFVNATFSSNTYPFSDALTLPSKPESVEEEPLRDVDLEEFWNVWTLLKTDYIPDPEKKEEEPITQETMLHAAIEGLTRSVKDPYTSFLPPEDAKEFRNEIVNGNIDGIGAYIKQEDGVLTIARPLKDSPADKAGILPGDIVTHIDGVDIRDENLFKATNRIRGPRGTDVVLTIIRATEIKPIDITITRAKIVIPSVETEIRDGVYIITVSSVTKRTTNDLRKALISFVDSQKEASRILLDLRSNPGGILDGAVSVAGFFLPEDSVVLYEYEGDKENLKTFRTKGSIFTNDRVPKMTILVDRATASSAEIIAAALRYHGIADIVGTPTHGKGSVQTLKGVGGNALLKITTAHWLTPEKESITKDGVVPDVDFTEEIEKLIREAVATDTRADINEYELERAIEHLKNK